MEKTKIKIIHHNDDDGRCAAATVRQYLLNPFEQMGLRFNDFIQYKHSGVLYGINEENLQDVKRVYIVDLALDDVIFDAVKMMLDMGIEVIHIDHHISGIKYYENHKYELSIKYIPFMFEGASGCLLTFIYSYMSDEQKLNPMNVKFDISDDGLFFMIEDQEYRIPDYIAYINDNDIFANKIADTPYFTLGFSTTTISTREWEAMCNTYDIKNHLSVTLAEESDENLMQMFCKHPTSVLWDNVAINNILVVRCINNGKILTEYLEKRYAENITNNSFVATINGKQIICLNYPNGNSRIFGKSYYLYDAVCKYSFNGEKWIFTFYSKTDGADVNEIINYLKDRHADFVISGGGHTHAGGLHITKNIFELANYNIKK